MVISFVTPTFLSPLDLTVLGGSDKRGDSSKIGQFSTGFKYAIALCLRNNIMLNVIVKKDNIETEYTISSKVINCEKTNKSKEVIIINEYDISVNALNNHKEHITGYSVDLGFDWNLDKVFTELYSNMLDEGGQYYEYAYSYNEDGTYIYLDFESNSEFADIVKNKDIYVLNPSKKLFKLNSVEFIDNPSNYLTIYKNGILVYKDEKMISKYAFNVFSGDLDERRILKSTYDVGSNIWTQLCYCQNETILKELIRNEEFLDKNDWLNTFDTSWTNPIDFVANYIYNIFKESGEVFTLKYLIESVKKRGDCILGERKMSTINQSISYYSKEVTVLGNVQIEPIIEEHLSLKEQIESKYDLKVECELNYADINGTTVIADKFNNCLLISEQFNIDEDISEFIIQYYQLTSTEHILKKLSKELVKYLKK